LILLNNLPASTNFFIRFRKKADSLRFITQKSDVLLTD